MKFLSYHEKTEPGLAASETLTHISIQFESETPGEDAFNPILWHFAASFNSSFSCSSLRYKLCNCTDQLSPMHLIPFGTKKRTNCTGWGLEGVQRDGGGALQGNWTWDVRVNNSNNKMHIIMIVVGHSMQTHKFNHIRFACPNLLCTSFYGKCANFVAVTLYIVESDHHHLWHSYTHGCPVKCGPPSSIPG